MRADHQQAIANSWKLRPVPSLSLPDWCDQFRRLSAVSSAISGNWQTSRFEVARGPMMATREDGVEKISIKVATQMMKTELLLNVIAYNICNDPAPMLMLMPKDDAVRAFAKERLAPMIRATPALRDIFGTVTNDKSGESLTWKEFPGGSLTLASAGSPTNLAMRAVKTVLADEIDKYEATKAEGDPLTLAEARTLTYPGSLHIRCCSPTFENESRIDRAWQESDQRKAFVACPHCGHEQTMEFFKTDGAACVEWSKGENGEHFPSTAGLVCSACGAVWDEAERLKLVTTAHAIKWKQTRKFKCCGIDQIPSAWRWDQANQVGRAVCVECGRDAVPNTHAGFQASRLYSPKTTVVQIAEDWLKAKDDYEMRQAFVNTVLAETFSARAGRQIEVAEYITRRESFGDKLDPRIVRLFCGGDVQDDRIELHVLGVAWPEEWWSIHYERIFGDPSSPEIWREVYRFLKRTFPHPKGELPIHSTCIDSGGHFTEHVYNFCRPRLRENIWAIKGASWSKPGDPVVMIPKLTAVREIGYKPQIINVDVSKDYWHHVLMNKNPGPNYLHIPDTRDDAWLEQLFRSETPIYESRNGHQVRRWVAKKHVANEVWDTLNYAYAAYRCAIAYRKTNIGRLSTMMDQLPMRD